MLADDTLLPLRVLITASRTWDLPDMIGAALLDTWGDAVQQGREVVWRHGHCRKGGDAMADAWLVARSLTVERHPADWYRCTGPACTPAHRVRKGRGAAICPTAGLDRDARMVEAGADQVLAFIDLCVKPHCRTRLPHGSHGASYTADLAEKAGIHVRRFPSPALEAALPTLPWSTT